MSEKQPTPEELAAAKKSATDTKNVTITFTKPWNRYSRGDVAGFPADRAKQLVEGVKVAVNGSKLPE